MSKLSEVLGQPKPVETNILNDNTTCYGFEHVYQNKAKDPESVFVDFIKKQGYYMPQEASMNNEPAAQDLNEPAAQDLNEPAAQHLNAPAFFLKKAQEYMALHENPAAVEEPLFYEEKPKIVSKYKSTKKVKSMTSSKLSDLEPILDFEFKRNTVEIDQELLDNVKNSFVIKQSDEKTYIFVTATYLKDRSTNSKQKIPCSHGYALVGYVKDVSSDCYLINACDVMPLGYVPMSLSISIEKSGNWHQSIPLPENVIDKFLNPDQRKKLKVFKEKYPTPDFEINYVQLLGCH